MSIFFDDFSITTMREEDWGLWFDIDDSVTFESIKDDISDKTPLQHHSNNFWKKLIYSDIIENN